MTRNPVKGRMIIILIASICLFSLFLSKYFHNKEDYVKQFILTKETLNIMENINDVKLIEEYNDRESSKIDNIENNRFLGSNENTKIKVSAGSNIDNRFLAKKYTIFSRNVFVELNDIKRSTNNIFFVETRCSFEKIATYLRRSRGFVLNARQCCALESTAMLNPNRTVYILHSCLLHDDFFHYSPKFVEELFKYPNVYVVRLNTTQVFMDSPVEDLDKSKIVETSKFPVEHMSDLLRFTLLWKFGGTYCDLDIVAVRPLTNLKTNWAGKEDHKAIGSAVLNFEPEGPGHDMLQRALEYINKHFDPVNWTSNGPKLITATALQECKAKTVSAASTHCNGNFTVFNSSVLYPVHYSMAENFFGDSFGEVVVEYIKRNSYIVHIWNKLSHDNVITVGSKQAYALLAEEFCPRVYRKCGDRF